MARKKSTPYSVQVRNFVLDLAANKRGAFSAKSVYEEIQHPARHDFKSSIGRINQRLHMHWSHGDLVSFSDKEGVLLREEAFVAPGSAAVEHPQVFAAPGTRSPKRGFRAISYQDFHAGPRPNGSNGAMKGDAAGVVTEDHGAATNGGQPTPEDCEDADFDPSELAAYARHCVMESPAPEWIPDSLMREWVTRPQSIQILRQGFSQAEKAEQRQLILTGLQRKGEVRSDSASAGEIVKLCRKSMVWWERCSNGAYDHYLQAGRALPSDQLPRLFDDLDQVAGEYDLEVVVLTCLRLGLGSDEVQVLAAEAADEIGGSASAHVEEELNRLRARVQLAEEEMREAQTQAREDRKARVAAERKREAVERQRANERAKAGGEATQLADLRRRLDEGIEEKATLESERDALLEDVAGLEETEKKLGELRASLTETESELALAQQEAAGRVEVEGQLQDALRTIGELNVRVEDLARNAGVLPTPSDATSLVALLDAGIGSLLAESSARMLAGAAGAEDQQLLTFAAHFVDFKRGLAPAAQEGTAASREVASDQTTSDACPDGQRTASEDGQGESDPEAAPSAAAAVPESEAGEQGNDAEEPDELNAAGGERDSLVTMGRRRGRVGWVVRPLGGAGEIGGSALLVSTPSGHNVLLDAGQRVRGVYGADGNDFHYGIPGIENLDAILVTHAHIDHCGSLPVLHRNQSARQVAQIPVYMSEPTRELAAVMMHDSAKIQHARERDLRELGESDWTADMFNSKPAYSDEEVRRVLDATEQVTPFVSFDIPSSGISARFEPVAHVLGSCAVHLTDHETGTTLLYTGDLGPISHPQLTLPEFGIDQLSTADVVVMESTYGKPNGLEGGQTSRRALETRRQREIRRFEKMAQAALKREGFVLVPSFSLGRAQEIVRLIYNAADRDLASARIYIGGMAERILETYTGFADRGERESGIRWVTAGQFPRTTSLHSWLEPGRSYAEIAHELLSEHEPGFIIASPATMTGGWAQTFANEMIDDPRHAVIFSGFLPRDERVAGPLSSWKKGSTYRLGGEKRTIQCDWDRVGLSAHAPADDLRLFARQMAEKASGQVSFLCVHGLPEAQRLLAEDIGGYENVAEGRGMMNAQSWTLRR